jgi:hypothetical protein
MIATGGFSAADGTNKLRSESIGAETRRAGLRRAARHQTSALRLRLAGDVFRKDFQRLLPQLAAIGLAPAALSPRSSYHGEPVADHPNG